MTSIINRYTLSKYSIESWLSEVTGADRAEAVDAAGTGARRMPVAAFLAAALLLALVPRVAFAQEPPAAPPEPSFPGAQEVADAILRGLGDVLRTALDAWWDQSGPVVVGRLVAVAFGAVVSWFWTHLGPLLSSINFFTRIPPQWSYELAPLAALRARLTPIGSGIVLLGLVLGIGLGAFGLAVGRPFARLLGALPTFLLATGGLLVAPQFMAWWVRFCNAASDAILAPDTGLPGLARMEAVDRLGSLGVVALVYLLFGLWFLLLRLKLLGLTVVLFAGAPLCIAAGALPFPQGQRLFHWWLTTFLATTFVQVLQALCLAIGGWLLAAPVATGGAPSDASQDLLAAAVGAGIILGAASLPPLLLGSLARAGVGGATINTVLYVGSLLAGLGGAGAGFAAARHFHRPVVPPPPPPAPASVSGVHVRSLLGGAPLALPPPT